MGENAQHQREKDQTRETEHAKMPKTDITQLVATHPEMPEEMELIRESRKQNAELTLEYPTKQDLEEEADETEKRRNYTCANCKKSFRTTVGKTHRLRNTPGCRKVHPKKNLRTDAQTVTEPPKNRTNYENIGNTCVQDREK